MATSKVEVIRDGDACHITLPVNPVPAARPRVGKYGAFYPKNYAEWRARVKELLAPFKIKSLHSHACKVQLEFVVSKPAKPARQWPRGDVDNYVKAFLDAVTTAELYWYDDVAIVELVATKRYVNDGEKPCTIATIEKAAWVPIKLWST